MGEPMDEKMSNMDILERVELIADTGGRYPKEAFLFVMVALEYTVSQLPTRRHLSGQELSKGIAVFARDQFGYLAREVLGNWKITATSDFGEIVYTLIENGLLSKTDEDSKADFKNVFDFETEFTSDDFGPGEFPERF
jgi:uncharacterized repeat protein (TIGR04138 family)